jgi:hypothetical protein
MFDSVPRKTLVLWALLGFGQVVHDFTKGFPYPWSALGLVFTILLGGLMLASQSTRPTGDHISLDLSSNEHPPA